MKDIRERIVGVVLAVIGIAAMVLAFGGGAAHAASGIDQSVSASLAQEETSAPESSDSSSSDASDASDNTDNTDESESPTPFTPSPTSTTEDTPSELPTDTGDSSGAGTSPLGWLLLGGGVLAAGAAFAVYRRGA
jgi:cytoskeletal protein RodZ